MQYLILLKNVTIIYFSLLYIFIIKHKFLLIIIII
jgi:hypothetical protein